MTVMNINISDELKVAVERAFPSEPLEVVVERALRAEVARRQPQLTPKAIALRAKILAIRENAPPTSNDEIRALRHEGRI